MICIFIALCPVPSSVTKLLTLCVFPFLSEFMNEVSKNEFEDLASDLHKTYFFEIAYTDLPDK